jgi:predicted DNA binding CopG/RHH family protein
MTLGASVRPVFKGPKTPRRTIRVPDELWDAVKAKAADEGTTVTDVIVRCLRAYLRD